MNKKLLMFGLPILAIGLVAAVVTYYAMFSMTFTVLPSITLPECSDTLGTVYTGDIIEGSECTLTNNAETERNLLITNDAIPEIEVSYKGTLELSKKNSEWTPVGEPIEISYTLVGDDFEVTGVPDGYTAAVSNTQRYKMLGNGWTVNVIAHIFNGMQKAV